MTQKYSDLAPKEIRRGYKHTPRHVEKHEALPRKINFKNGVYRTGDGDVIQHQREGSDHSHIKSIGDRT